MKRLGAFVAVAFLAACTASSSESMNAGNSAGAGEFGGPRAEAPTAGGSTSGDSVGVGAGATGAPSSPTGQGSDGGIQAGTLTAGTWDDNLNFEVFNQYVERSTTQAAPFWFTLDQRTAANAAALAPRPARTELDVALVVDTTGSMGDELRYLQVELDALVGGLKARFPNVTPRWSLVFYRDQGDEYVVRSFPFTTDTSAVRANLGRQAANGGGDFPEAVPEGLNAALAFDWRSGDVARALFWVADAPAHATAEGAVVAAIQAAQQKAIHVHPVAASGIDPRAELTMRAAAQMTGGRYTFLTDDSGIGNTHTEPKVPCYYVTKLIDALEGTLTSELTGTYAAPEASRILRTVGKPTADGHCAAVTADAGPDGAADADAGQ